MIVKNETERGPNLDTFFLGSLSYIYDPSHPAGLHTHQIQLKIKQQNGEWSLI